MSQNSSEKRSASAEKTAQKSPITFGEHELLERISSSPSGNVYRARHELMGRTVLLKMMPEAAKTNEEARKRFQREMRLAAQLTHPNLVTAYHSGCHGGVYYLVMENIEGTDLRQKVKQDGPLDVAEAVDLVCQAAKGLKYLHDQGVFHRNVKPGNLLLDSLGTVHVTNMTLALVDVDSEIDSGDTDGLTRQGQMIGTADYVPPEQAIDAHTADHRSDVYSLGCTLYYLLTGKPPYPEKDKAAKIAAHTKGAIPSLRAVRDDVSEKMDAVFQKMLAKMPSERHQSMKEVIAELQQSLFGGGESLAERPRVLKWELLIGGIILGMIVAGLVAALMSVR